MENESTVLSAGEAEAALAEVSADRQRLVSRVPVPWLLMAAFGGVAASFVAAAATTDPGAEYAPPPSAWLALAGAMVVAYLVRRETGIRFRSIGVTANLAVAAVVAICVTLFSVSLGLVAFDLRWAVAGPSLVAFGATTWLAGAAFKAAMEHLRVR